MSPLALADQKCFLDNLLFDIDRNDIGNNTRNIDRTRQFTYYAKRLSCGEYCGHFQSTKRIIIFTPNILHTNTN